MANQISRLNGSNGAHSPTLIGAPGARSGANAAVFGGEEAASGGGMSRYVHALRRRWVLSLVVAMLLAPVAMLVGWFVFPALYTASATVQLKQNDTPFMFPLADGGSKTGAGPFDLFKRSQQSLIKHPIVLARVLDPDKHPGLAAFPVLKEADDRVEWLQHNLNVSFPGDSEYMRITLSATAPTGLKQIVIGVVDEYFDAAVGDEQKKRRTRLEKLQTALTKESETLRRERGILRGLEESLGGANDSQSISKDLTSFLSRLTTLKFQIRQEDAALKDMQEIIQQEETAAQDKDRAPLYTEEELVDFVRRDATTQKLEAQKQNLARQVKEFETRTDGKPKASGAATRVATELAKQQEQFSKLEVEIHTRKQELAGILTKSKRDQMKLDATARQDAIRKLKITETQLGLEIDRLRGEASKAGVHSTSIEVIAQTAVVEGLSKLVMDLRAEVNKTQIELSQVDFEPAKSSEKDGDDRKLPEGPRIKVMGYEDARPAPITSRIFKIGGIGGVAFVIPFVIIVFFEAQKHRISTRDEITQTVGLSVIGAVPILPQRVMQRLGGPSERDKYWRSLLSESVDSIAAVLLRGDAGGPGGRVLMVSSANAGEGKTTLAAHLAVSLAGAGRHVILVDFDLRRPALHRVFGVSLEPGAADVLRAGQELEASIQATQVPNLMVLPSGRWSKAGLAGLAATDLQALFDRLRGSFEFVIVDASPILPVVDTRLIGQHVDAVLLSVLRDVSRAPKLRAACELLDLFGIPVLGVVVTGPREEIYKDERYEAVSETQTA